MKRTLVMVILDGWGIGRKDNSNPIYLANPENVNYLKHHYPSGTLQASGIAVGLPWGEEGNSEVGHLTLGAGKVLFQHYPRISLAIKDGSFFKNKALLGAFDYAKKNNSRIHFIGLLGEGNIHSSFEHLLALIDLAGRENFNNYYLHLFTDGRDSAPQSAINLIDKLPQGKVASLAGRFFAMDRDLHWQRTERAYQAIRAKDTPLTDKIPTEFLSSTYNEGTTDEFIEPTVFKTEGGVRANDSVIFFNFREDNMRQLTQMFIDGPQNLFLITFTEYSSKFNLPVAFPKELVENPLGKILSDNDKVQLRIAETEKYAHITYFFNGFVEPPFKNEYRVLIPSRSVARQDEFPEMMAEEVTTRVLSALAEQVYDFILVNYANPDVIAHTGNFEAAEKAVQAVDKEIGLLLKVILDFNGILLITSDHGNVERMIDPKTGMRETKHDPNPVPIYLIARDYERQKNDEAVEEVERTNTGVLSDVAPTILELMGIMKPKEMTGVSLLRFLR